VVQRQSDINETTWRNNHQGTIAFESGSEATIVHTHTVNSDINVVITEKDHHHFCNGHTVREFAFDQGNIDRVPRSTFWPVATTPSQVLAIADGVLGALHSDIVEAVGTGSTYNSRAFQHGGVTYTLTISTDPDLDSINDSGNYEKGTARLEQFYPVHGTGILGVDKADLTTLKTNLGK